MANKRRQKSAFGRPRLQSMRGAPHLLDRPGSSTDEENDEDYKGKIINKRGAPRNFDDL